MLALFVPWLLFVLLLFSIILIYKRKWIWVLFLLVSVILVNRYFHCLPVNLYSLPLSNDKEKLKVMTFNIKGIESRDKARRVFNIVRKYKPDITFIPEFKGECSFYLDSLLKTLFQYTTFPNSSCENYFYSKYLFKNYRRLTNGNDYIPGVYACDVVTAVDTVRVFGCHLASNNYNFERQYITPDSIQSFSDVNVYVNDIRQANKMRAEEVMTIVYDIEARRAPFLIMGDMNDVIGSNALNKLESAGFSDAWWEDGFGYGATISNPLPYRIDHIMYNDYFKLNSIDLIDTRGLSDHRALYAEFEYR